MAVVSKRRIKTSTNRKIVQVYLIFMSPKAARPSPVRGGRAMNVGLDASVLVRVVSGLPREQAEAVAFRLGQIPLAEVVG